MNTTKKRRIRAVPAAALAVFLTACSLNPPCETPSPAVPAKFPHAPEETAQSDAPNLGWNEFFKDERLKKLIALGLENNHDLRLALLNAETVRAQYRIRRSSLLPSVSASGAFTRQRVSEEYSGTGMAYHANALEANIGLVSYELDLFGRVRSLSEAAFAQYLQAEQNARAAKISLVAEIAAQYYAAELAREQLELMRKSLETTRASLKLVRLRHEKDVATKLDCATAEAQFHGIESAVKQLEESRELALNALALLVGGKAMPADFDAPAPLPLYETDALTAPIRPGLPSETLRLRPDIAAAEQALRAANANIGAARAAFFPTVSLTGTYGFSSTELEGLFSGNPARAWTFAPSVSVPIFSGGRLSAELDVAKLRRETEIINYDKAVQTAFREVADELAAQKSLAEKIVSDRETLDSRRERCELTDLLYRKGSGKLLDVFLAQNDYFDAQQTLAQSCANLVAAKIRLYKALGGGIAAEEKEN